MVVFFVVGVIMKEICAVMTWFMEIVKLFENLNHLCCCTPESFGGVVSVIVYKVSCMLAGIILWHMVSNNKTKNKLFNFKILYYATHNYKWGYSLTIKKIMTCVMQQDMTHERTELWMCFSLDYDVFVQLSQKQLLSSIHLNLFCGLVSICTSDHMDLHNFLFCSKVVGNSFEHLSVLNIF